MKIVPADQARRTIWALLDEVAGGEEVVITRYGKSVARLVPLTPSEIEKAERAEACRLLMQSLRKGFNLGGRKFNRDELYERYPSPSSTPSPSITPFCFGPRCRRCSLESVRCGVYTIPLNSKGNRDVQKSRPHHRSHRPGRGLFG